MATQPRRGRRSGRITGARLAPAWSAWESRDALEDGYSGNAALLESGEMHVRARSCVALGRVAFVVAGRASADVRTESSFVRFVQGGPA
jgi:hypothetical protein